MNRTAHHPRVHVEHPRRPEPSFAYLWAVLDGKREDAIVTIPIDEAGLYGLAEDCLKAAAILREQRAKETA